MAAEGGGAGAGLSGRLAAEPYRFDFFQAVRVLERALRDAGGEALGPVGRDVNPGNEAVRFKALLSLGFPAAPVTRVDLAKSPAEMEVAFLGLVGAVGVMPHHYTQELIGHKGAEGKAAASRAFLDLFTHRMVSLFFRAWEKYRLLFAHERYALERGREPDDPITWGLYCLAGLGTGGLRGRLTVPDVTFLYYGGRFAQEVRNAEGLEAVLSEYFAAPVAVIQFQGQWLNLGPADLSVIGPTGRNNALGQGMVVGRRVWDVQGKFRLRLGPVGYAEFTRLMPQGDKFKALSQLARMYAGPEFDFDIQPVLKRTEVPPTRLGKAAGGRLGWNTWLKTKELAKDADQAVFAPRE
ncbi:MAG: type VI secretion system baseplate subunit TssG [Gemmataceae bacterium]